MANWILFVDAAYPPPSLEGALGLCFYAGGDTPHVWSVAEIEALNAEYLLPVWVRSDPTAVSATTDANDFVNVLKNVYHAPTGILVALDSETSIDPAYVKTFVTILNAADYLVIDYGSQSDVMGNDNPDGYYWGADPTGVPHIDPGDVATQYKWLSTYDLSEFGDALPLWKPGAPPTNTPTLREGMTDPVGGVDAIHNAQTRLNVWRDAAGDKYAVLTVDGDFGAATLAAVKDFQTFKFGPGPSVDGIIGPKTWAALNTEPPSSSFPAPTGLAVSQYVLVTVSWKPVTLDGAAPESYSVASYTATGQPMGTKTVTGTSTDVVLGLGKSYQVRVWANGGPAPAPYASISVTV